MSIRILQGDCRLVMASMDESSIDAVVCDPPYEYGFMGKGWDSTGVAFDPVTWREALRVLKPGGYLLAFSSTRTYHRMACAIEDVGFEIRDQVGWLFGSGFPKSHNGEWGGTALKPAWEPICMARKPLIGTVEANWREHGTGALNIDASRVGYAGTEDAAAAAAAAEIRSKQTQRNTEGWGMREQSLTAEDYLKGSAGLGRWPANVMHDGSDEVVAAFPNAPGQLADASSSSSSRKAQNVYGAMKRGNGREAEASADSENEGAVGFKMKPGARRIDSGSAARFFYCAKADKSDRDEGLGGMPEVRRTDGRKTEHHVPNLRTTARKNHHPTVKPTDLMRYLCRLVTPGGGIVLDPFMGSGSTLKAAELEGFSAIGIELDAEYIEIAKRRIAADMPLFAEVES